MSDSKLMFPLKGKYLIMLAPSFVVDFSYPEIIFALRELGFDKVVEITFGAKMVNREYHNLLKKKNELVIATTCPGVVEFVKSKFPKYKDNLALIDSPMIAMAKICKKTYPHHKIVFLSPCNFKKLEAGKSKLISKVIDFGELENVFSKQGIVLSKFKNKKAHFDKFYNEYTKIYPVSGGLSKTAHLRDILKKSECVCIDGVNKVQKFLEKPDKKIKFLDCTFCNGGCIGGPLINSHAPLLIRKISVLNYRNHAKQEDIPEVDKGLVKKAQGLYFKKISF